MIKFGLSFAKITQRKLEDELLIRILYLCNTKT